MATSAADIQQLIVLEVGDEITDAYPEGVLASTIGAIWASYADKASVWPRLQELYSRRRAVDVIIGALRGQVDFKIEGSHSRQQSDKVKHLIAMRAEAQAEIARLEARARANRAPASGELETTAPLAPPDGDVRDANSRVYRGDPYTPPPGRRNL